jgi:hypothetical protein
VVPFWGRARCPSVGGQRCWAQLNRHPLGRNGLLVSFEVLTRAPLPSGLRSSQLASRSSHGAAPGSGRSRRLHAGRRCVRGSEPTRIRFGQLHGVARAGPPPLRASGSFPPQPFAGNARVAHPRFRARLRKPPSRVASAPCSAGAVSPDPVVFCPSGSVVGVVGGSRVAAQQGVAADRGIARSNRLRHAVQVVSASRRQGAPAAERRSVMRLRSGQ